jgi:hypothetical protein
MSERNTADFDKTGIGCLQDSLLNETHVGLNLLKKIYYIYIDKYLELFGIINKTAKTTSTSVAHKNQVIPVLND